MQRHDVRIERLASIHAPARGATPASSKHGWIAAGFNPRSRTGSDFFSFGLLRQTMASIHAPARGATGRLQVRLQSV